ncbi:MAG: DMT family transporter [Mycetocola sp.]
MLSIFRVIVAGAAVVILWASVFPAIRFAAPEFDPVGLSLIRLVVAAAALVPLAIYRKVRLPARRDLLLITAAAAFGMAGYQLLENTGELSAPAGTTSVIISAAPLVSFGIAAVAFKERLTMSRLLGSGIALGGVIVVAMGEAQFSLSTDMWIVVAAMAVQGIYHPLSRLLLRTYNPLEVATYAMVAGTFMTLPLLAFDWEQFSVASGSAWLGAAYLGIFPSAVGFLLWGYVVARLPLVTSTSLLYFVPPVAILLSYLWLGEASRVSDALGAAIILIGVIGISQGNRIVDFFRRRGAGPVVAGPAPAQGES